MEHPPTHNSKVGRFLSTKKVTLIPHYTTHHKVPDITLTTAQKLTHKNLQLLKLMQLEDLLSENLLNLKDIRHLLLAAHERYAGYLEGHMFYRQFYGSGLTDLVKREKLLPMLVYYFVLDKVHFPLP